MQLQTLCFGPDRMDGPVPLQLTLKTIGALVELKQGAVPRLFVVRLGDLKLLKELGGTVSDLGKKDTRIQLARYFLDVPDDQVPVLQGTYTTVPQLKRGIRAFLAKAGLKQNIYFLGVADGVFKLLLEDEERNRQKPAAQSVPRKHSTSSSVRANARKSPYAEAFALRDPEYVPEEVKKMFVGESEDAQDVRQLIMLAAKNEAPVLIQGETGTGKSMVARAIHKQSVAKDVRKDTFIVANLAEVNSTLIASELFGHLVGAFTDAKVYRPGLFKSAHRGTIFLDEVGELPLEDQKALLRVVEDNEVRAVGADKPETVNVRIIAATNRDLFSMVQRGQFREDLYWRLRVILVQTPALRDNPEDIPLLAQGLWKKIDTRPDAPPLPPEILNELKKYRWMGNARLLRTALVTLHSWYGDQRLQLKHINAIMPQFSQETASGKRTHANNPIDEHRIGCLQHLQKAEEAIRYTKIALRALAAKEQAAPAPASSLQESVADRIHELDKLCLKPSLFYSSDTYQTIYQLKGKLMFLQDLLPDKTVEARKYYAKDLKAHYAVSVKTICKEIQHVLADYDRTTHDAPYAWMVSGA